MSLDHERSATDNTERRLLGIVIRLADTMAHDGLQVKGLSAQAAKTAERNSQTRAHEEVSAVDWMNVAFAIQSTGDASSCACSPRLRIALCILRLM